MKSMHSTTTTH